VNQKIEPGLDAIQLHGEETPAFVRDLHARFVIKALRVGNGFSPQAADAYPCDAILVDAFSESARGGTGERCDWPLARALAARSKRVILAGGLTPENVREAIEIVRPFAVDVCSGVEDAPGRKNAEKLRRFVAAVQQL
jgi:phosphoribosylanthranilate isomerase